MTVDPFEQAIYSIDQPIKSAHPETHSTGTDKSMAPHRHPCCAFCKGFGTLETISMPDGNNRLQCKRCNHIAKKAVYLKNSGPSVSATFVGKGWDISDGRLPNVKALIKLREQNEPAFDYLSFNSLSGLQNAKACPRSALKFFIAVTNNMRNAVAPLVPAAKGEASEELRKNLTCVISLKAWARRAGGIEPTKAFLADVVGVDNRQFFGNRRWSRICNLIDDVFYQWHLDVEDAFSDKN